MAKKPFSILISIVIVVFQTTGSEWIKITADSPSPARVKLISSTISSSVIKYSIDGFYLNEYQDNRNNSYCVRVDNAVPILMAGYPDLVKLSESIIIPDQGEMKLNIVSAHFTDYTNMSIAPSYGDMQRNGSQNYYSAKSDAYRTDAFYPNMLSDISEPFILRDLRGQTVTIFPFQYNPIQKILRVYTEVIVELVADKSEGRNPFVRKYENSASNGFKEIYNRHFLNYRMTDNRDDSQMETTRMLIISYGPFIEALQPLIDWKLQCGIICDVVDVAQIGDAEAIKNYVTNYYYSYGLSYLLLVGDIEYIPSLSTELGISDNSYGYIAGTDHYPDIFVGRFSASTLNHVRIQVEKSLRYEKNEFEARDWLSKSIGIGSNQGPGDDNEMDYEHVRNLQNKLLSNGYSYKYELFDGNQGDFDAAGNPTSRMVKEAINEGASILLYTGVGDFSSWGTSEFNVNDVFQLNNANRYPFIISAGCYGGAFNHPLCFAEAWLRASDNDIPTGAVAAFMTTGQLGWYPSMHAQDEMISYLLNGHDNSALMTFGGMTMSGCMAMNDKYGIAGGRLTDIWTIFGDPSLILLSGTPKTIYAQHEDVIYSDAETFEIKCDIDGAQAVLTCNDQIVGAGKILEGVAHIKIANELQCDEVTLTIIANNCIPYIKKLSLVYYPSRIKISSPVNCQEMVSPYKTLQWSAGNGSKPQFYKIYIGTDNPPTNLLNGLTLRDTFYLYDKTFEYNRKYFWRVDAYNQYGFINGDIWQFKITSPPDEDFEDATLPRNLWGFEGIYGWQIDSTVHFNGLMSCKSGQIGANESSSMLFYSENTIDDFVSFWFKISSESGKDRFEFLIDGNIQGEWSGEVSWVNCIYFVPKGKHVLEWKYAKDERDAKGSDAVWIDDVYLPINEEIYVDAGWEAFFCEKEVINLTGDARNFTSVKWTTNGTGIFTEPTALNTTYIPCLSDYNNKNLCVTLTAYNEYTFTSVNNQMKVNFTPYPIELNNIKDTTLSIGEILNIDAFSPDIQSYLWMPSGFRESNLIIDSREFKAGTHTITLKAIGTNGCLFEKSMNITFFNNSDKMRTECIQLEIFPNPNDGIFNLKIDSEFPLNVGIIIYDIYGKIIYEQKGISVMDIYSEKLDLSNVENGLYFIQIDGGASYQTKKLIIQK